MRIGNYIKIGTFIIIGIFVFPYVLCAQNGYYFFSDSDKVAIRNSANTLWGSVIVESMKEKVKERRSHKMEVPLLEGGIFMIIFARYIIFLLVLNGINRMNIIALHVRNIGKETSAMIGHG